jgi:hypothetical protein
MPKALLFAAELLCVLVGAKPVAMVQYGGNSVQQTRTPLVTRMLARIVDSVAAYPSLDLAVQETRHGVDESLLIYRQSRSSTAFGLLPRGKAQALHIVPYLSEDEEENGGILRQQVYNSFWNGYLLGYPEEDIVTVRTHTHMHTHRHTRTYTHTCA